MTQCVQRTVTQPPDATNPAELTRQYLEVIGQLLDHPDDPAVLQRVRRLIDEHLAREERRGRLCRVSYGQLNKAVNLSFHKNITMRGVS